MKTVKTLIKISKNKLEKIRIEKNLLIAQSKHQDSIIKGLNDEILDEESLIIKNFPHDFKLMTDFINFRENQEKKIALHQKKKKELEKKIEALNSIIKNLFSEKKKYEIIEENATVEKKNKQKDTEQKNLNETVLQKFSINKLEKEKRDQLA
jgi:hypothetical protein